MKITNNGLKEMPITKDSLLNDCENLALYLRDDKGHLGDVLSMISTTISSMKLKLDFIKDEFEMQKNL